jgi:hypothetical protein
MAHPTGAELREAIALVSERMGYGKLHERLVRLNAFVSRRKPPSPAALADRLYTLTGGLRRNVPATVAFHTVWAETVTQSIAEGEDKTLETLADRINATLTENERAVREDQGDELDRALGEYEAILAPTIGPQGTRLEMLFKAVPAVAERLRRRPLPKAPEAEPAKSAQSPEKTG